MKHQLSLSSFVNYRDFLGQFLASESAPSYSQRRRLYLWGLVLLCPPAKWISEKVPEVLYLLLPPWFLGALSHPLLLEFQSYLKNRSSNISSLILEIVLKDSKIDSAYHTTKQKRTDKPKQAAPLRQWHKMPGRKFNSIQIKRMQKIAKSKT